MDLFILIVVLVVVYSYFSTFKVTKTTDVYIVRKSICFQVRMSKAESITSLQHEPRAG